MEPLRARCLFPMTRSHRQRRPTPQKGAPAISSQDQTEGHIVLVSTHRQVVDSEASRHVWRGRLIPGMRVAADEMVMVGVTCMN